MKKNKPYIANPAPGEALLAYQGRIAPSTESPVFEAETVEEIRSGNGDSRGRNLLMQGDCLSTCAWLRENKIAVDLVYIDPPFASGADYAKKIFLRNGGGKDEVAGDSSIGEDVAYGDIWQKEDYLNWLFARLVAIREVMSETASIYVHLDWHIGHYAKVLLDEVFGEENFRNEIIWAYRIQGVGKRFWARKHDTIFLYGKSAECVFNSTKERVDYGKPFIGTLKDAADLSALTKADKQTILECLQKGAAFPDKFKKILFDRHYAKVHIRDVWDADETKPLISGSAEYREYPTQKPEKLLERIIKASSNENSMIADFFVGSGTTAAAAHKLGRQFVVSDTGANAIQTSRDTLKNAGASFDVLRIRDGVRLIRNPAQTAQAAQKILSARPGWTGRKDADLGDFWDGGVVDSRGKITPVKFIGLDVKLTRGFLGGVLAAISEAEGARDDIVAAEIVYAHKADDVNQKYADKAAAEARHSTVKIRLISLDDFLGEKAAEFYPADSAQIEVAPTKNGGCRVAIARFFSPYLKAKIDDHNGKRELTAENPEALTISETGLELIESVQFACGQPQNVWRADIEDRAGKKSKIRGVYDLRVRKFRLKIRSIAGDEIILDQTGKQV